MRQLTIVTAATGVAILVMMVEMLRRRQLSEKYAVLWLAVGVGVLPFGFFPQLIDVLARLLGVASGVSLVLFAGIVFLLVVSVHLSWEVSRLEEETRVLAEEVALIHREREARDADRP